LVTKIYEKYDWHRSVLPIGPDDKFVIRARPLVAGDAQSWLDWFSTENRRREPASRTDPMLTFSLNLKITHVVTAAQQIPSQETKEGEVSESSDDSDDEEQQREARRQLRQRQKTKKPSRREARRSRREARSKKPEPESSESSESASDSD
jgi:hypothetical protein